MDDQITISPLEKREASFTSKSKWSIYMYGVSSEGIKCHLLSKWITFLLWCNPPKRCFVQTSTTNTSYLKKKEMADWSVKYSSTTTTLLRQALALKPWGEMAHDTAAFNWFIVLRCRWQERPSEAGFHQRLFCEITNFSSPLPVQTRLHDLLLSVRRRRRGEESPEGSLRDWHPSSPSQQLNTELTFTAGTPHDSVGAGTHFYVPHIRLLATNDAGEKTQPRRAGPDSLKRHGLIQWGGITLDSSKRQTQAGGDGGACSFACSPIHCISLAQNGLDVSYADGKYIIACLSSWKCKSYLFLFFCKCMFHNKAGHA